MIGCCQVDDRAGINVTATMSIVAVVGDFSRFKDPTGWYPYRGLNPRIRQSANGPSTHGRVTTRLVR